MKKAERNEPRKRYVIHKTNKYGSGKKKKAKPGPQMKEKHINLLKNYSWHWHRK